MTKDSVGTAAVQGPEEKTRRRNAWALLVTHAVVFVLLLMGFALRVRYAQAEDVHIDWIAIILAAVATVVFIVLLALLLVFRRRAALRHALTTSGVRGPVVLAYWSRMSTPPFLTQEGLTPLGRGLDVAITADPDGIHVRARVRRRLVDFGLIPWSHLESIDSGDKSVGVGIQAKGGVVRIGLRERTPPYADRIELFPLGQAASVAVQALTAAR
ncbi:hypothetical protein [Leifsonia sp. EB34]|uniref:hypothetical protein n=1 Tax=Leifsonia sp. EB34 TaxID=3156303 RepID=UPI0035173FB9